VGKIKNNLRVALESLKKVIKRIKRIKHWKYAREIIQDDSGAERNSREELFRMTAGDHTELLNFTKSATLNRSARSVGSIPDFSQTVASIIFFKLFRRVLRRCEKASFTMSAKS
jgi:hypothetical protein